jgi:aminoglycoside phosphotransferase (APT) family kinase protein
MSRKDTLEPLVDLDRLSGYLDSLGLGVGEPTLERVGRGLSNVTFLVSRGEVSFILRRPPRPPWPPSAHDVLREARVQEALAATPVRVPRVLAVCADDAVLGVPFYLLELVDGALADEVRLDDPGPRRRFGDEVVDALAEIHEVDHEAVGLGDLGRPSGYLERQLRRFAGLWEHNATRPLALVDELHFWLAENLPEDAPPTLVHGDYRLGNLMMDPATARVLAVLDWEMSTLGDPLADLGYLLTHWADLGDPPIEMCDGSGLTDRPGYATRAGLIDRYEARTGRGVHEIVWYETLALWKSAIFMEGNYKRFLAGSTDVASLADAGAAVETFLERAQAAAFGATEGSEEAV